MNATRCPSCSAQLRVGADASAQMTCPRCLAELRLDGEELRQAAAAADRCPGCQQRIRPDWQACPHCRTALQGLDAARHRRGLDYQARRDLKGAGPGTIALACVGAIYAAASLVMLFASGGGGWAAGVVIFLVHIAVVGALGAGWVAWKNPGAPQSMTFARVTVHAFAALGGLVLAGFAALMLLCGVCFGIYAVR